MSHSWPLGTQFNTIEMEVAERKCSVCGIKMHVCDHRHRHVFSLSGPLHLLIRLLRCPDPDCPCHHRTFSPYEEFNITMPWWAMDWPLFSWIGHRRMARHWSVPQIRGELKDSYQIEMSEDAIEKAIRRYQIMLAAREQDPARLAEEYKDTKDLVLSIDGLQPEKGHETLYVVRELRKKRVWFAESLISSSAEEVRRLIIKAREWAERLGLPVSLWISDKQDAFVTGIAKEFEGVPHRYCDNHFLRDLAKPMLEMDSHTKVKMRKKIRGLRGIERDMLEPRAERDAETEDPNPRMSIAKDEHSPASPSTPDTDPSQAEEIVLDYCSAVRGILNNDQGGPLRPPGIRMADALREVQSSLHRNLDAEESHPAKKPLQRLAGYIGRGLEEVRDEQEEIRGILQDVHKVSATLDPDMGSSKERLAKFHSLQQQYELDKHSIRQQMAKLMDSFSHGLFIGEDVLGFPTDNLDLERWFKNPKGHERRIHGHAHAGVRIVQEGPTLILALDAHLRHPAPFSQEDLYPYADAKPPACQQEAIHRRKVMRKARSSKMLPKLLQDLEQRYRDCSLTM